MELEFRKLEFQNATIGLPKLGMGQLYFKKKKLQENATIGL